MYRAAGLLPHDTYPSNTSSILWVTKEWLLSLCMCADVAQRDMHFPDGPLTGTHAAQSGPLTGAGSLACQIWGPSPHQAAPWAVIRGQLAGRGRACALRRALRRSARAVRQPHGRLPCRLTRHLAARPARPGRCCHYLRPSSTMRQQLCCASSLPRPTQTLKIIALNAHSRHCNGSACRSKADWAWTHVLHQICQLFLLVCTGCLGWEISPPASWTWQATRPLTGWRCPLRSGLGIPPAILHILKASAPPCAQHQLMQKGCMHELHVSINRQSFDHLEAACAQGCASAGPRW